MVRVNNLVDAEIGSYKEKYGESWLPHLLNNFYSICSFGYKRVKKYGMLQTSTKKERKVMVAVSKATRECGINIQELKSLQAKVNGHKATNLKRKEYQDAMKLYEMVLPIYINLRKKRYHRHTLVS